MLSYIKQLDILAKGSRLTVLEAFKEATGNTAPYYRAMKGHDLRLSTAEKVADVLAKYPAGN